MSGAGPSHPVAEPPLPEQASLVGRLIRFCLENRLVVGLFIVAIVLAGVLVAPFEWEVGGLQRYPVPVDAIPDIGENQQIVFTQWMGRSPQDVEDQIGYRLTVSLLGIPGVKTIRSYSMFGFSTIYIIFKEDVEFYWSRARVLEKLASLPAGTLPEGVQPTLGPDATALGQVYWYTLEGQDLDGRPTGGWGLEELRTIQDWYARYWLLAADGVAEVASIGGYVKEYQVDVDPDAMRAYGVSLEEVYQAVRAANIDVGAKTIEINRAEYFIRGVGFIKTLEDLRGSVVKVGADHVPVLVEQVAQVGVGPAARRGALDKGGAPVVGGVVVARYGDNPLAVINHVKAKIEETRESLPAKVLIDWEAVSRETVEAYAGANGFKAYAGGELDAAAWLAHLRSRPRGDWPSWATLSRVAVVPFYDRTGLIYETLGTLNQAIVQQILVTVIVVLVMVLHLRSSLLISGMLPLTVLLCFVGMKLFGVQANIVA
ncbi:MAG: efflux RND transporter permease subunit, partial [Lentisphaeria bacterium]|nr:efflux RND transporter permease subunit [Lentisphaeria bacterium]